MDSASIEAHLFRIWHDGQLGWMGSIHMYLFVLWEDVASGIPFSFAFGGYLVSHCRSVAFMEAMTHVLKRHLRINRSFLFHALCACFKVVL